MTQAPGGPERTTGNVHMGSERRECLGRGVTHPPGSFQRQAAPRKVEGPLVLPHHRPPAVNLSQGLPFSIGGQWPEHVRPRRRSNWIMDEGEEGNGRTLCARAQGHSVRRPVERDAGRPRQLPSSATEEAPGSQAKRAGSKDRETDVFWGVGRRQRGLGHSGIHVTSNSGLEGRVQSRWAGRVCAARVCTQVPACGNAGLHKNPRSRDRSKQRGRRWG